MAREEPPPKFSGVTNQDLLQYTQDVLEWGSRCNLDKKSISAWSKALQQQ